MDGFIVWQKILLVMPRSRLTDSLFLFCHLFPKTSAYPCACLSVFWLGPSHVMSHNFPFRSSVSLHFFVVLICIQMGKKPYIILPLSEKSWVSLQFLLVLMRYSEEYGNMDLPNLYECTGSLSIKTYNLYTQTKNYVQWNISTLMHCQILYKLVLSWMIF